MVSSQAGTLPCQVHLPINTHSHQSVLHLYNLQICTDKPGRLLCARISTQLPCPKFSVMEYVVCFAMNRCNIAWRHCCAAQDTNDYHLRANQWFCQFHIYLHLYLYLYIYIYMYTETSVYAINGGYFDKRKISGT